MFSPDRTDDSVRIYTLKREIAEMRRAVIPLKEPMRQFAEGSSRGIDRETMPFFRDVYDHVARAAEAIDALDNLLTAPCQVTWHGSRFNRTRTSARSLRASPWSPCRP